MTILTERLLLRPWRITDAEDLYKYASDERIGPPAGWKMHESVEESINVLKTVLMNENTWAVCEKGSDEPIGSIGIFKTPAEDDDDAWEIGYWIGVPFWGRGYIPEAVKKIISFCFEEKNAKSVWCSHADFNDKSRRVIEKCGFTYRKNQPWISSMGDERNSLYYSINREDYFE